MDGGRDFVVVREGRERPADVAHPAQNVAVGLVGVGSINRCRRGIRPLPDGSCSVCIVTTSQNSIFLFIVPEKEWKSTPLGEKVSPQIKISWYTVLEP